MIDFTIITKLHEFLPSLPIPKINYPCEDNCPFYNTCEYLGCYFNGVINLKSIANERVLVHEYGHYIYHSAIGNGNLIDSERFAQWFEKSFYNPILCDLCSKPLVYNSNNAICLNCKSFYTNSRSLGNLVLKSILISSIVTLLTAFITNSLPMPEEPLRVKLDKSSKILASVITGSFISLVFSLTF